MRAAGRGVVFAAAVVAAVSTGAAAAGPSAAAADDGGLRFSSARTDVPENAGHVTVTIQRGATDALDAVDVAFSTVEGTAAAPDDFIATRGRVHLGVGATSAVVQVAVRDDSGYEPSDEWFGIRLLSSDESRVVDQTIVVIHDDDVRPTTAGAQPENAVATDPASRASAPAPALTPTPVRQSAPAARARTVKRAREAPRQPKITPFRLQSPRPVEPASLPAPAHATPLTATGLIASLLLARVLAELWFRWRTRAL